MLWAWQPTSANSSGLIFVKRGFTQEELAHRVGMDVSYLSELENGRKEPCLRKMKEVSQALDIPLSQLLRRI
jgi:transcriptional regulator with XRE-family HTH domain